MKWVYLHSVRERVVKGFLSVHLRLTDGRFYGFFLFFVVIVYSDHNEKPGSLYHEF